MAQFRKVKGSFKIKSTQVFRREIERRMPIVLAAQIERHFRQGFEKGGGQTDDSRGGWKKRKKPDAGRGILIKSGLLRRDVKQRAATFRNIIVGTSNRTIAYAQVHNEGLQSGRGAGFIMPKREFIGYSLILEERNAKLIAAELKKMLI